MSWLTHFCLAIIHKSIYILQLVFSLLCHLQQSKSFPKSNNSFQLIKVQNSPPTNDFQDIDQPLFIHNFLFQSHNFSNNPNTAYAASLVHDIVRVPSIQPNHKSNFIMHIVTNQKITKHKAQHNNTHIIC